jgi:DNA-binding GntR family transcriptional regulator
MTPTRAFRPIRTRQLVRDQVFERLLHSIERGDLRPGEDIKDVDFQHEFGVSRTPIREAILRLSDLGLVEMQTNRYTRVAPVDLALQKQRVETAVPLIALAARVAGPILTDDDLARAHELFAALRALDTDDHAHHAGLDLWFSVYQVLVDRAGNEVVAGILIDQLGPHLRRSVQDTVDPAVAAYLPVYIDHLEALFDARQGEAIAAAISAAMMRTVIEPMDERLRSRA